MFGIGWPELLILFVLVFVLIIGPIWLVLFLRKKSPNKTWLAILLCFIFPIFGQLYLKKAGTSIFLLIILGVIAWQLLNDYQIAGAL